MGAVDCRLGAMFIGAEMGSALGRRSQQHRLNEKGAVVVTLAVLRGKRVRSTYIFTAAGNVKILSPIQPNLGSESPEKPSCSKGRTALERAFSNC